MFLKKSFYILHSKQFEWETQFTKELDGNIIGSVQQCSSSGLLPLSRTLFPLFWRIFHVPFLRQVLCISVLHRRGLPLYKVEHVSKTAFLYHFSFQVSHNHFLIFMEFLFLLTSLLYKALQGEMEIFQALIESNAQVLQNFNDDSL